jgi:hypothetical protein
MDGENGERGIWGSAVMRRDKIWMDRGGVLKKAQPPRWSGKARLSVSQRGRDRYWETGLAPNGLNGSTGPPSLASN